jgi:hypothetical protein
MLFQSGRINDKNVDIKQDTLPFVSTKDFIHKSLEYTWTISKSKWHSFVLMEPLMGTECGLWSIFFGNLNLIEAFVSIKRSEIVPTGELRKDIVDSRKRVLIGLSHFIQLSTVDAKAILALLMDKNSWCSPWRV